jgi:23S rRNA (guanosine2251-2'-O)-methyltransferase
MASETPLIAGWHAVFAALDGVGGRVLHLWLRKERRDERAARLEKLAAEQGVTLERVGLERLDKLSSGLRHQGVLASVRPRHEADEQALWQIIDGETEPLLLVLDGVQDPHNLGACLRTADAAGVHAVIVPKDRAAGLTPAVRKVAAGAAETVPLVRITNLARCLRQLQKRGVWLVGATGDAKESLFDVVLRGPLALVLGGENKGLRRLTREHCDALAHLPMAGSVSSLNVSVAAGVTLYEALRQRQKANQEMAE